MEKRSWRNVTKDGRRAFLLRGGALAGAAFAALSASPAGATEDTALNVPEWMKTQGRPILSPAYGQPADHEKDVIRRASAITPSDTASWSFTPLQDLLGTITPNGLFFERHHGGVPSIVPERHRLLVHGLVERPLLFTMDDLLRFPAESRIHFLECSGNGYSEWKVPTGESVQFTHGLLSCCEWTGAPLATVLDEVGVKPEGKWILAEGADAAAMTRSIPLEKALDDALVVYAQNGEHLRPEQGYPLRLLLPGFEGNMSVKWLRRLKIANRPFQTHEETSKYTDLMPDGTARQFSFYMEAKSVITFPSPGQSLRSPGFYEISGLAWTGHGRVRSVDVSVDGGRSWNEARLQEPVLSRALTRFRLPWKWNGAPAILQSRVVDASGYVQPTRAQLIAVRGTNSQYHYNGIQSWQVTAEGEVRNVHA